MKKKSFKHIRDTIYNNPRADRQDNDNDEKDEAKSKEMTLYDENNIKQKMIDRIIRAYQAKKLMLKAQEIQRGNIKEQKRSDLVSRMIRAYNKSRDKIKNQSKQTELSQSEKRMRKLADLNSRSNSWKGLEGFDFYAGENQ